MKSQKYNSFFNLFNSILVVKIDKIVSFFHMYFRHWVNFYCKKKFYHRNYEKISTYYLDRFHYKNRLDGLSAMMRVKNDEKWILYAIKSIIDEVDEIVIVLQNCTDRTEEIIDSFNNEKIKKFHYPFNTFPTGEFHSNYLKNSVFNLAYYYNYALSKTKYSYVWKFDGDQVVIESRLRQIIDLIHTNQYDIVHARGWDMFGSDLIRTCREPFTSMEPLIFKVNKFTYYFSGDNYEHFSYPLFNGIRKSNILNFNLPLFCHMKYAQTQSEIGKGWPSNWRDIPYFISAVENKTEGELFMDDYPFALSTYFALL